MEFSFPCVIFGEKYKQLKENAKEKGDQAVALPKVGMTFLSEKEMREYCSKYAESVGFDIAKRSTKCGDDGKQKYFSLACSRNGHTLCTSKNSSLYHQRSSSKTNCKAKINVSIKGDEIFMISRVFLEHNHELTPGKARYFRYNKAFKPYCKRKLDLNEIDAATTISLKRSFNTIRVEDNIVCYEKEAKKHRVEEYTIKPRINKGDVEALVSFFSSMQAKDPTFFYTIDVDEEGRIKNVFWADLRCRPAYESFPDVVTFDTTYLKSHCNLPLASFFGVNHHGQAILLGCGLIFSDEIKTFTWLMTSWMTCMHGRYPKTIVFDESNVTQSAIDKVFPNSNHCLNLSNIMNKVEGKLEGLQKGKEIERAIKNAVYESSTCGQFEETWRKIIEGYSLIDNEWLKSLYEIRRLWVPVYVKSILTVGLSQKVEIAKEFFEGFVLQNTTLKQFLEQYDKALERNIEKEKNADFASSSFVLPTMTNHPIEKQMQKVYTNDIFKLFQEEWRGLIFCNASLLKGDGSLLTFEVTQSVYNENGMFLKELACEVVYKESHNQINCSCCLFESRGILCRHIISVLMKRNVHEVPSCYILGIWRKDNKRSFIDVSNERGLYDELNLSLFDAQKIAIKSKEQCQLLKELLMEVKAKMLPMDLVCSSISLMSIMEGRE